MPQEKTELELAFEARTGQTIEWARNTPVDEQREYFERRAGRRMRPISRFPVIGRGNVLRDYFVTHEEAEAACDEVLNYNG